jgi:Uncharacterized conserved protein (DUF2190)
MSLKLKDILAANGGELPRLAGGATDKVLLREVKLAHEEFAPTAEELEKGETGKQFYFVELTTEDQLVLCASGAPGFVLLDTPKKGEYGTFALAGVAKVKASGTIEAGERVQSATGGTAVAWATAGHYSLGIALEKAVTGQIFSMLVGFPNRQAT